MSASLALLALAAIPPPPPPNPWFHTGWRVLARASGIATALGETRGPSLRLRDIPTPEAVVVVDASREDVARVAEGARKLGREARRLALRDAGRGLGPAAIPLWMDPTVTLSGGNVVARIYPLGGSRF